MEEWYAHDPAASPSPTGVDPPSPADLIRQAVTAASGGSDAERDIKVRECLAALNISEKAPPPPSAEPYATKIKRLSTAVSQSEHLVGQAVEHWVKTSDAANQAWTRVNAANLQATANRNLLHEASAEAVAKRQGSAVTSGWLPGLETLNPDDLSDNERIALEALRVQQDRAVELTAEVRASSERFAEEHAANLAKNEEIESQRARQRSQSRTRSENDQSKEENPDLTGNKRPLEADLHAGGQASQSPAPPVSPPKGAEDSTASQPRDILREAAYASLDKARKSSASADAVMPGLDFPQSEKSDKSKATGGPEPSAMDTSSDGQAGAGQQLG